MVSTHWISASPTIDGVGSYFYRYCSCLWCRSYVIIWRLKIYII